MVDGTTGFWRDFFATADPGNPPVGVSRMHFDIGSGEVVWVDSNGDSVFPATPAAPAGTDTAVQFNNAGDLGGDADAFAWDDSTASLTILGGANSAISIVAGASQSMDITLNAAGSPPTASLDNTETDGTISIHSDGDLQLQSDSGTVFVQNAGGGGLSFFGVTGHVKETVTGSKGANAALTSLLAALAAYGLITDSTT
jgi:hypothetical protein